MAGGAGVAVLSGRGKTGRAVISALGRAGAGARPLGRAEAADLRTAMRGCEALYLMAPNMSADEPSFVDSALRVAREVGIRRVVHHSVAAPYAPRMPHHLGKAVAEDLVRRSGLDWTILQPCAYVQNLLPGLRADPPGLDVVYDPDRSFGLVDVEDVGEAAATVLLRPGHIGATYELGGPELVSVRDVAGAAEAVLGRPVPVRRTPTREWSAGAGAGLDRRVHDWLLAMFAYYDRHGLPAGPGPLTTLLGRPPKGVRQILGRELA